MEEVNPIVKISTADYAFDNLDEMKEAGIERTNYLSIYTNDPSILLKLEPHASVLESDDDAAIQKGTTEKIKTVLAARKTYLTRFLQSGTVAGIFIGSSFWYLFPGWSNHDFRKVTIGLTALIVGLLWSWWAMTKSRTVYPTIHLSPKRARPNVLDRKKGDIVLALISAIAGAIVALVISKLIQ